MSKLLESQPLEADVPTGDFKKNKIYYFARVGFAVRQSLEMHKQRGFWQIVEGEDGKSKRDEDGKIKRDWENVTEHCLVEAARASVLGDLLGLPTTLKHDLQLAAALHDFGKKDEKEISKTGSSIWEGFELSSAFATKLMNEAEFDPGVIRLVNSVGHTSLLETQRVLKQPSLSPEDVAYLLMHYIDDYTVESDWAAPTLVLKSGERINSLDQRMDKNEATPRYAALNQEGRRFFNGETTFQAQRRIGNLVEQRVAELLRVRAGINVKPKDIPVLVDNQIKLRIQDLTRV